jgi:hypothetical protein
MRTIAMLITIFVGAGAARAETVQERLNDATTLFTEIMAVRDRAIPQDLLRKATCIVLVPRIVRGAVARGRYAAQ